MAPSVYWRRRALGVGAAIVGLLLLVVLAFGALGGHSGGPSDNSDGNPRLAGLSAVNSSPASPGLSLVSPSGSLASSTSGMPSSSGMTPAAATTAGVPSVPPSPCADSSITLAATVDQPSYSVGQHPQFAMVVVNIGQQPCVRNVGRSLREILISDSNGSRLWSSNDCSFVSDEQDMQTLQPGQQLRYGITWLGRTTAPGCPRNRQIVQAGSYTVTAKLGGLSSAPIPFKLT